MTEYLSHTCQHCRWWKTGKTEIGLCQLTVVAQDGKAFERSLAMAGGCYALTEGTPRVFSIHLDTMPTFGCNQWQTK